MQTIPKKTFLKIMKYKKYTPVNTGEGVFDFKGVKYYLKFEEIPLRCLACPDEIKSIIKGGVNL